VLPFPTRTEDLTPLLLKFLPALDDRLNCLLDDFNLFTG